jgi:hypothetical protein
MSYDAKARPKASISARVIRKDGTIVDLGVIAGEGKKDPANEEKGRKGRELLNKLFKKEAKNGR